MIDFIKFVLLPLIIGFVIVYGISLRRYKKKKKEEVWLEEEIVEEEEEMPRALDNLKFNVSGVNFNNDSGDSIQLALERYVENHSECKVSDENKKLYNELFPSGGKFEYSVFEKNKIKFMGNQIEGRLYVYHDDIGNIGHVPQDFINRLRDILDSKNVSIFSNIYGGAYDYDGEEEIGSDEFNFSVGIVINYVDIN